MTTSVMTLREYADLLDELATEWDGEQPAVLVGDVTGDIDVTAKNGYTTYSNVGFAHECFDGTGVWELGNADTRFFGTMLLEASNLDEEAQKQLEECDWGEA